MRLTVIILMIASSLLTTSIYDVSAKERAYISIAPFYAPEKIWRLYSPLIDYLNKSTNIHWELKVYPSHEAIERAVCNNDLSIALLGPLFVYRTHKECGAEMLLAALDETGKENLKIVIVSADKRVRSIKDLVGQRIGLFKPYTAAHGVTKKMLFDEGVTEANTKFVVYQNLERLIDDVMTGAIKAGGVRESSLKGYKNFSFNHIKASGPLPNFFFVASPDTSEGIKKTFVKTMLRLKPLSNERDKRLVQNWDEVVKYGYALPPKDCLQELEGYYLLYYKFTRVN